MSAPAFPKCPACGNTFAQRESSMVILPYLGPVRFFCAPCSLRVHAGGRKARRTIDHAARGLGPCHASH